MIIDKYKVIFIHIPKNAGTSIEEYFGNESVRIQPSKHADIYEIKTLDKLQNQYMMAKNIMNTEMIHHVLTLYSLQLYTIDLIYVLQCDLTIFGTVSVMININFLNCKRWSLNG